MEPRPIGEIIPAAVQVAPGSQLSQITDTDKRLQLAIQEPKLRDISEDELRKMMQYIFLVVGIRGQNIPVSPEKEFLHQYIRTHYGGHTAAEVRMAFDMAIQGKLRIPVDEVKCYENFSIQYFANIMNYFRAWSSENHKPGPGDVVDTPKPEKPVDWRPMLEDAYQHFLSFGPERVHHLPIAFYDQLVQDGALCPDLFRRFMGAMRKKLIAEQVRERTIALNNISAINTQIDSKRMKAGQIPAAQNNIAKMKSAIKITELKEEKIEKGERDGEIVVMAKQHVVMEYFKELKEIGQISIYKVVPPEGQEDGNS